jgi:HNH endonuclease
MSPSLQLRCGDARTELAEIPGFPGYAASRDGRIWSRREKGSRDASGRLTSRLLDQWRPLRPHMHKGYPQVAPCVNGKNVFKPVHQLILLAWVGPCPDGCEACHNNGNRADASLSNLRWDTRAKNHADKRRHGTALTGIRNPAAKLSDAQIVEIRRRRAAGERAKDLAQSYGVHPVYMSYISRGLKRGGDAMYGAAIT